MPETKRFKDGDYVLLEDIKTYCEKYEVDQGHLEKTIIELFVREDNHANDYGQDDRDNCIGILTRSVGYWQVYPKQIFNKLSVEDVLGITEKEVAAAQQPFITGDYVEVVSSGNSRAEVGMKGFVKSTKVSATPNAPTKCQMVTFESNCGITMEMYNGRFKHIAKVADATPQDNTIISPEIKQTLDELGIELVYRESSGFGLFHDCLGDEEVYVQTKEEMLELFGAIRIILKFTQV